MHIGAILVPIQIAAFVINILVELATGTGVAGPKLYHPTPDKEVTAPASESAVHIVDEGRND